MKRSLYLAAYDIAHPSRLRAGLKILKDYAGGGQKSVFECHLSEAEKRELLARLNQLLHNDKDRFFIIPLDERGMFAGLGKAVPPQDDLFYYVG